ncbi:MAG: hypothetical protein P8125_03140 [Gemmatimonadota bacterium]
MKITEAGLVWVAAGAVILAGAAAGCTPRNESLSVIERPECRQGGSGLSGVESLEGEFLLRMSADTGNQRGYETEGHLTLIRRDSTNVPLSGWTTLDPAKIGAYRVGDPGSRDPAAPGVLVLTRPGTPGAQESYTAVLRLGSQANRSDIIRFDGAFTALYVRWIEEGGFGGDWAGGVQGTEASGEFCAVRASPSG